MIRTPHCSLPNLAYKFARLRPPHFPACRRALTTMTIPKFDDMRTRLMPVWEKEENKDCILWAGIFGSVGRGRAHEESDVDVVMVMKENITGEPVELEEDLKEACACDVSYVPIWHGPELKDSWMWGHVRIEALLSSRTVFGNSQDVQHLKQEGLDVLSNAIVTYDGIAEAVRTIKACVAQAGSFETFSDPTHEATRHECYIALQTLLRLLDIPSLHDPIRTMAVYTAFEHADKMRAVLANHPTPPESGDAPLWKEIWPRFQSNNIAMWSWDIGCAGARKYIDHMLASARLAKTFEEGGVIDDTLYTDIVR